MQVKEGDVLVCNNGKCEFHLKVVRTCSPEVCGGEIEYDFDVIAGGKSVVLYKYEN